MVADAKQAIEPGSGRLPDLTPLEIASGVVLGAIDSSPDRDVLAIQSSPHAALRALLIPALSRQPCFVAFSGGRDSSAMLATATTIARELGFPDPVPLTNRYPAHSRTDETEWQEMVVRHLSLREWVVRSLTDELDVLGPLAAGLIRRHGLYWSANAHTMAVMLAEASGGSLVTGNGGDEMFSPWHSQRMMQVRSGSVAGNKPEDVVPSDAPARVRRMAWYARRPVRLPWLTAEGSEQLAWVVAERWAEQFSSWKEQLDRMLRSRNLYLSTSAFQAFARDANASLVEPFLDPRFIFGVAATLPPEGPRSRAAALEAVFGQLLPRETTRRSTKAVFTEVFWGPASRSFVAGWDGNGVDTELIDPVALRAAWAKEPPDLRCMTALQAAWLAGDARPDPPVARRDGGDQLANSREFPTAEFE